MDEVHFSVQESYHQKSIAKSNEGQDCIEEVGAKSQNDQISKGSQ